MKNLLAGCAGEDFVSRRDTAIILLLADTGMRRSELAGLSIADLDLRARVVEVADKEIGNTASATGWFPSGPERLGPSISVR